jgi:hypothetical protein
LKTDEVPRRVDVDEYAGVGCVDERQAITEFIENPARALIAAELGEAVE